MGKYIKNKEAMSAGSLFLIFLVMGLICVLLQPTPERRRRALICQVTMSFSFICFSLILLLGYLYVFGEYEGVRIASFSRYISIFFLGWALVIIGFFVAIQKEAVWQYRLSRKLLAVILVFLILCSPPAAAKLFYSPLKPQLQKCFKYFGYTKKDYLSANSETERVLQIRLQLEQSLPIINKYCPLNSRIYYIWQNDLGLNLWIMAYNICPRKINTWGWSVGKPYYEGDVWTQNYTPSQLSDVLKEYDYILIGRADDNFWKGYRVLFKGIDKPEKGILFKIEKNTEGNIIIKEIE
ncbi:MAG: hypothetical protein ABSB18_01300 [Candidatus Omnitrophota bacterium]